MFQISPNAHNDDRRMKECAVAADTRNKLFELLSVTDFGRNVTLSL